MNSSVYDDTGRGAQSLKVHRLLDKARRVMAIEKKKELREHLKLAGKGGKSSLQGAGAGMMSPINASMYNTTGGMSGAGHTGTLASGAGYASVGGALDASDDDLGRTDARRIGPFSFDVDDDIDTEVLTNEQVYDDLKELKDILDQGQDMNAQLSAGHIGKAKRRR